MNSPITRRQLVQTAFAGTVGILGARQAQAALEACGLTPAQQEGPYYPQASLERDSDLTRLDPESKLAAGQVIYVTGQVQDEECRPLSGAMLEVWQACSSGKYNHSDDPNPLKLDPDFQYWGRARTDKNGNYTLKTIVPGHYPVGGGRFRPPHIHFKVYARLHFTLTTQMYFTPTSYDDPALAKIVDELNNLEAVDNRLKVEFKHGGAEIEKEARIGRFDVTLKRN